MEVMEFSRIKITIKNIFFTDLGNEKLLYTYMKILSV